MTSLSQVTNAAEYALSCLGRLDGQLVVTFIGGGDEYDGNAWAIDTPLTGRIDLLEVETTKIIATIAGPKTKEVTVYEVYFWKEVGGTRMDPPDWVEEKVVEDAPTVFHAMCDVTRKLMEQRLGDAAEAWYWNTESNREAA